MKLPKNVMETMRGIGGAALIAAVTVGCATSTPTAQVTYKPGQAVPVAVVVEPVAQVEAAPQPEPEPDWDYDAMEAACGRG